MKIVDQYIQEHYAEYDDRVKVFISRVFEDCKKNNEKLSNYFFCCLDLLANQLKLYYLGVDSIDEEKKVSSEDNYKRVAKNPAIAVMSHAHTQILDIMEKLGLSPFASAKIKRLSNVDTSESAEELLEKLIN